MKLLFFDLETTGTNHGRNGIHQISGQVVIDGIVKESFDFHVQPNPKAAIEDEALAVAGVTREQIAQYPAMGTVYRQFVAMLGKYVDKYNSKDKFFLVGYNNAAFDNQFLRGFFLQNNDKFLVHGFGQIQWMLWFLQPCILQASARKWRISNCQRLRQRLVCKWMVIRCTMQCMTSN